MVSKKDALIVGVALIGGLGVAQAIGGGGDGGIGEKIGRYGRAGGILSGLPTGVAPAAAQAPTVYQVPGETFKGFPEQVDYSDMLKDFLGTEPTPIGTTSGRGKKIPSIIPTYTTYVRPQEHTPYAPVYTPLVKTPAAIGVTAALEVARGGKPTISRPVVAKTKKEKYGGYSSLGAQASAAPAGTTFSN